jgi:energy-coupling factor transporter ATP-binding protein EcfA2
MEFRIDKGTRTFLSGKTNSGKSTLGYALLESLDKHHKVIVDPKHQFDFQLETSYLCYSLEDVALAAKSGAETIIVRFEGETDEVYDDYDALFSWILRRGNTVVYIDELYLVMKTARTAPESLKRLYTQGRTKGITVIAGSQRPREIPIVCMSESENACIFTLQIEEDRKRIAGIFGKEMKEKQEGHQFWFINNHMRNPESFILPYEE